MLGAIIGDIVGSKYEFNNIKTIDFPLLSYDCEYTDDSIMKVCTVPKVLFGLREYKNRETTLDQADIEWYCNALNQELFEVFGHKFTFDIICFSENQYMTFRMKAAIKPPRKKMTLEEIEAVLGYEVEIIQ